MSVYPKQIAEIVEAPKFIDPAERSNAVGTAAKFDCGCFVRVEMYISGSPKLVEEVFYRTNGCGFMIAAAESISSRLEGIRLTDLHGLNDRGTADLECTECATAVLQAFQAAFSDYREQRVEEFRGERALICTCFGVEEETVEQFVRESRCSDVNDVSEHFRAGSGCGSCRMLIQEIIDANG